MDKEDKKKRLIGRHDGEGVFVDMLEVCSINILTHKDLIFQNFETIMELDETNEEPDFLKVDVTAEMSREEVVDLILKKTKNIFVSSPHASNQTRLVDGYYKPVDSLMHFWKINGDKIEAEDFHNTYDFKPTIKYGDFGKRFTPLKKK